MTDSSTRARRSPLDLWFARMLRDAFALNAVGDYAPFGDLARGALVTVLTDVGVEPAPDRIDRVLGAFSELPAYADAEPAMAHVASREIPVLVLTNGSRDATERLLISNDLDGFVDGVVTDHDVGRWKPAPEPYRHAARTAGVNPAEAAMVAVHGWDTYGARCAGLRTGWCSRLEHRLAPVFAPVDVEGPTLVDVVVGLVG